MTFTPFNLLYESGSEFKVSDPITNQENKFYLSSASGATSEEWYWDNQYSGNSVIGGLVWADYLGKFVTMTDYVTYISTDGTTWVSGSDIINDLVEPYLSPTNGIAVANNLGKIVIGRLTGNTSKPMAYSTDGLNWSASTASAEGMYVKGISYSPTLQRFVSVGLNPNVYEPRVAYSDDGINFTVLSGSTYIASASNMQQFFHVTWDASGSQFVATGDYSVGGSYSGSIHTSTDGINWNIRTVIPPSTDFYSSFFYRIITVSGSYVIVGDNPDNITPSRAVAYSNGSITNWNYITNLPISSGDLYDITYSPFLNKFVAVGQSEFYGAPKPTILYSSDILNWYTASFSSYTSRNTWNRPYGNIISVAWSPTQKRFVAFGLFETFYSYDGEKFFTKNESYTGSIGFTSTPAGTLYNTPLTPWTSSITTTFGTDVGTVTSIEFDLMVGPDPNTDISYVPTSSYGIIIDSASLSQFYSYPDNYIEDVEVDGIRYLREITQEEGNEYPKYNYGYYETDTFTLHNYDTSEFTASLKSAGRDYVLMYYSVSGNQVGDNVAMILNLANGTVEYYEDASNYNAPGSYNLSGNGYNDMRFIQAPTLTDKTNNYWELKFSVGFRTDLERSGSIIIT